MIRTELIEPIGVLLVRHARERPRQRAFEDARGSVTWSELERASARLAGHLDRLGVEAGARVAVLLPNSVAWVAGTLAIARAGALSVPISHDATEPEIRYRLEDAGCRAIIVSAQHAPRIAAMRASLPELTTVIVDGDAEHALATLLATDPGAAPRDPDDVHQPAFIVYTSGTTGRAKGVVLTLHSLLWVTAACWAPIARLGPGDTLLSPLPLFHSYALSLCVLSIVAVGASAYLLERYSTQAVGEQLGTGRFTLMPGVPTMFHYLLESARATPASKLPGLRLCISAGAIMPATLNREFESRFGITLLDGYGITETSTMVTMNWPDAPRVMGSCGIPVPGLAVRIVSPADGSDVAVGAEGELIVRGPNLMLGYHAKPQETASALRAGWYHTGDLARADANGFLTITGRLKELIIRGGQNIAPAEVEESVLGFAAVLDCAVIGAPHPHLGEVPVAFVVPRPGHELDVAALLEHCRAQLSAYKVPHSVIAVDAIPRTGSGKIQRFRLRERLDAGARTG